ncbi:DMT family transporter [Sulfurimonas sp.]|uniref:DMT family transporter n=1 Tax=Sulfurimonas sp. TaxID=2022749 RepID=UPI0025D0C3B0|nr:DMT family transporter [Sulfurimonas sp.]
MDNDSKVAYKYAFLSVFLWSTVASAFKLSLEYLTPAQLLFYSCISSLFILLIILLVQKKLHLVKDHIKKNFFMTLLLGLINPFLYYLVLFKAYSLLPAQEAQSINYTWALMLAFLSVVILKQKLSFSDILAGIICYFGVLVISTKGSPFSLDFSSLEGMSYAFLSTILWSFYWIYNTKIKVDPLVAIFSNFLIAFPIILVYVIFTNELYAVEFQGILGAFYIGIFEMGITFIFWLKAMQSAKNISKIANLIFISPFLSLVFIYLILKEPIYISTIIGLSMIIFGILIQQKRKNEKPTI